MEGGDEPSTRLRHISALDGARGAAVAGVLVFHGGHLVGGYLGVDFFFTLSGFLITSLLLAESQRTGGIGLGGFWARRARRLLPALVVLMVGVAVYATLLAKSSELPQIRGDAFATLFYVANWHEIFSHTSYFALFSAPSPLNHTWSLAIEEQFYVIWPLVFVALVARFKRDTAKAVLVTSLTLAVASSVLMIALYDPAHSNRAYFGTDTRAAAILFGAALAAALARYGPVTRRSDRVAVEALGIGGVLVLAIAWSRLDGQSSTLYRGGFLLCGLCATAIIAAAVHPERGPIARALSFKPLCGLGLISYGLYLYHWPIDVVLTSTRAHLGGWPLFALQTAVALAAALLSYRCIEQPIRHGRLTAVQLRRLTPVVAVALATVLFFTTAVAKTHAITVPASGRLEVIAAAVTRQRAAPGAQRIMIVGDSVAYYIGPPMQRVRADPSLAVYDAGLPGCNTFPGVTSDRSRRSDGEVITDPTVPCDPSWELPAMKTFDPDIVLWIASSPADQLRQGNRWISTCSSEYAGDFRAALTKEVEELGSLGAKVVITTSAYPRFPLNGSDAATDCQNPLRRSVAKATGSQLVDLFSYICPRGHCRDKQDGIKLRSDGLHYKGAGGEIVSRWILDQVRT